MSSLLTKDQQKKFLKNLLTWYKKHGRHDMPWRKTKDAYAVFVSEFMLQQTTVSTVRPYYDRFLKKFPTVKSLAKADLNDVLALWSGLGYYARARNLWAAMKAVQSNHKGHVPSDIVSLGKLPGVGPYTAGAISTLGFNKPAAVLDGNIIRFITRLMALDDDPKMKAMQVMLNKVANDLYHQLIKGKRITRFTKGGPRDLTLALMDMGASVCVPKNPKCLICPVESFCLAKKYGRQEEIPFKGEKVKQTLVRRLYAVIEHKGKWLMGQRPKTGLFGGLWEFIGVDTSPGTEPVPFLEGELKKEFGLSIKVEKAGLTFEHQLSHRIMVIRVFNSRLAINKDQPPKVKKTDDYESFKWVSRPSLNRLGLSSITKRILTSLTPTNH